MARKPLCAASRAEKALIVPTTCRGRSASTAARRRAPALIVDSAMRSSEGTGTFYTCRVTADRGGAKNLLASRFYTRRNSRPERPGACLSYAARGGRSRRSMTQTGTLGPDRSSAPNFHDGTSHDPTLDIGRELPRQLVERNGPGDDAIEVLRPQIRRNPLPDLQTQVAGRRGGIDAEQTHRPQNKWHDGRLEL